MAHTIVMVPEGHTVQVHPPGVIPQPGIPPQPQGVVGDPMASGGKAAMDAVMPPEPKKESPKPKPKAKKPEPKPKKE